MEKEQGTCAEIEQRPDRQTEGETVPTPLAREHPQGTGEVAKETYEEAIAEAAEDVHG